LSSYDIATEFPSLFAEQARQARRLTGNRFAVTHGVERRPRAPRPGRSGGFLGPGTISIVVLACYGHKIYADLTQYRIVTVGALELIDLGELDGAVREGTGLHRSP
jgi:hypothetical protein